MNIIVVVSDTLRRDFLGCYGNDWIKTPNIDRFAENSIIFDNAYTGSFPTVPQRSDLFTGKYCFHTRGWAPLNPEEATFPKLLRKNNYYTIMFTDTPHIIGEYMNFCNNFDSWKYIDRRKLPKPKGKIEIPCSLNKFRFPEEAKLYPRLAARKEHEHFCARTMQRAAGWLEENIDAYDRFLLYVDTFDPHEPWVPPQDYVEMYDRGYEGEVVFAPRYDYSGYLSESELKHMRALYAGMVTLVDKWFGFLIDKIEELGLFENSAVIFTSDHGFYHGEHGRIGKHTVLDPKDCWPLYEEVNHIPLIMRIPDMHRGRCKALVQPVDIMATILDLGGVATPGDIHGHSILPVLQGEEEAIREIAVSAGGPYFQPNIAHPPPHIKHQFALSPDPEYVSHSTITDGEWTLIYATRGVKAELYNLSTDPKQHKNVISENIEVARKLHRKYYEFLKAIGTREDLLKLRDKL